LTWAWKTSGYWVAEWLPQMVMRETSVVCAPALAASWAMARLWSRRVMAVNRPGSRSLALLWAIRQFVLAGLPTTRTFTSRLAAAESASPWGLKMPPLALRRSERSMPSLRGMAPTSSATSASPKAVSASSVLTMPASSGKAQSSSSMATPSSAHRAPA
jgi:hypothetical protein